MSAEFPSSPVSTPHVTSSQPANDTSPTHKSPSVPRSIITTIKDIGASIVDKAKSLPSLVKKEATKSDEKKEHKPISDQSEDSPQTDHLPQSNESDVLPLDPFAESKPEVDPFAETKPEEDVEMFTWKNEKKAGGMEKMTAFASEVKHTVSHSEIKSDIMNKLNLIGSFILKTSLDILEKPEAKNQEAKQKAAVLKAKTEHYMAPVKQKIGEAKAFAEKGAQAIKEGGQEKLSDITSSAKEKWNSLKSKSKSPKDDSKESVGNFEGTRNEAAKETDAVNKSSNSNSSGQLASPAFYTYLGQKVLTSLRETTSTSQGVFRIAPSESVKQELIQLAKNSQSIDEYKEKENIVDKTPVSLAGLYKSLFRDMPENLKSQIRDIGDGEALANVVKSETEMEEEAAKMFLQNIKDAAQTNPELAEALQTLVDTLTYAYIKDWSTQTDASPKNMLIAAKFFTELFYTPSTKKGVVGINEDLQNEQKIIPFIIEILKQNAIEKYPEQAGVFNKK